LDDFKETARYWKLKDEKLVALCGELALESGPVVRQEYVMVMIY
jgi:hypothetical protein